MAARSPGPAVRPNDRTAQPSADGTGFSARRHPERLLDGVTKQAYVKDLNTEALTAIAPVPNASVTQRVAFSSDGTQLIFVSGGDTPVPGDTYGALDVASAWTGQTTTGLVRDKADQVSAGTFGKIAFTDEDVGDTHTVTVKPGDGAVGTLTARIDRDSGNAAGVIAWDHTVDKAVAGLAKGQTKTETFTVQLDDGHGGTADQVVAIMITGGNEAPTISLFGPATRLSTRSNGHEAKGNSYDGMLSSDGETLLFVPDADDLVEGGAPGRANIYLKDLETGAGP